MDKKQPYSVDDILLEYELQKGTKPSKRAESPRDAKLPANDAVKIYGDRVPAKPIIAQPPVREVIKPVKPLSKKEADTRPLGKVIPVQPQEKNVPVSTRTRVLTVAESEEHFDMTEPADSDQLEGQLVMENFAEEPVDEEQLEEELRRRREEKIKGFRIVEGGKSAFKLTGEEEETAPEEDEIAVESEEADDELEDFGDYAETEAVRSELAYRRRMSALALFATLGMELLLVAAVLLYQAGWVTAMSGAVLTTFQLVLLLGMLGVNHSIILGGLKSFLKFRADEDTPTAICGILGTVYTAAQFAALDGVSSGTALFLSAAAGVGILAGRWSRQMKLMRISRNFTFVGSEKTPKFTAAFIDDEKTAQEIGQPADLDGIPPVMYFRKASFLTNYLEQSYVSGPAGRVMRWFVPLTLGVALLCAVGYGLLVPTQLWRTPTVFVATVLFAMPVWAPFAVQRAVSRSCKKSLKKGVMIGSWKAVEEFGHHTKAVIVDAGELFPKEQVKLHGIKTFSGTRIDEAITDAAAVVIAAGGPLSPIFHRLIENRTDILREVDSLAYEQDMGLSGWVGGRRVLIGNRRLLANHGVDVPSQEYEDRYTKDNRNTVYLSTGGELSAMFVVSYLANETVKAQVRALYKAHVTLLVRTCDPNVTAALICDVMDLPPRSVEMLTAGEGRAYEALLGREKDTPCQTLAACTGKGVSKLLTAAQCHRLYRGAWAGLLSQLVCSVAAMAFGIFVTASTGLVLRADVLLAALCGFGMLAELLPRVFRS